MCNKYCFSFKPTLDLEYCRAALQRSDRKEPRYKWPTLLYFTFLLKDSEVNPKVNDEVRFELNRVLNFTIV